MRRPLLSGLSALALTLLPLAAGTATFTIASAEAAFAGGGNGGGNGNGRGNGRGNGGGSRSSERGNGNGHSGGDEGDDGDDHPGRGNGNGRGAIASELKGLNACHASDRAFENASANSQVGRLAAYRAEAGEAETAQGDVGLAQKSYDDFEGSHQGRTVAQIDADIALIDAEPDGVADDPANDAALVALLEERAPADDYETELAARATALAEAQGRAAEAQADADEALLVASNGRELSDEAQAALDECLGG